MSPTSIALSEQRRRRWTELLSPLTGVSQPEVFWLSMETAIDDEALVKVAGR